MNKQTNQTINSQRQLDPLKLSVKTHKSTKQINALIVRMKTIHQSIEVNLNVNNTDYFNTASNKIINERLRNDPKMVKLKLKKRQNDNLMINAQKHMNERLSRRKVIKKVLKNQQSQSYLSIYQEFKLNPNIFDTLHSQQNEQIFDLQPPQLNPYLSLNNRTHILQYAQDIRKKKKNQFQRRKVYSSNAKQYIINPQQLKQIQSYKKTVKKYDLKPTKQQLSEKLIEKMSDYFIKKNKPRLHDWTPERCQRILQKQENIIKIVEQKRISKENTIKLKMKLGQIVNRIAICERKSHMRSQLSE